MNILKKTINTILFIMLWCFLVFFTACTSDNNVTDMQQEKQEEQTQQNEIKKGMTKAEQEYFAQAQPDIEQMISEFNEICNIVLNSNDIEDWKAAIPFAENCAIFGNRLENLQGTEETETLSNLVRILGTDISSVSENFIGYLQNNNIEVLKDWREIEMYDIIIGIHELSAYVQYGKTIQEQLKEELKSVLTDEEIENIPYFPRSRGIFFRLTESSTNKSLKKIYDIIKIISTQEKYDYLSEIRFGVDYYAEIDGKIWTFMYVEFNTSRKQLDFNTFQWSDIPEIADVYKNQMD